MEDEVATAVPSGQKRDTSHLAKQDLATLDPSTLTPLTPFVISRQATINIGTIGHVAHGKSTVVKSLSGVQVLLGSIGYRLTVYFPLDRLYVSRMNWRETSPSSWVTLTLKSTSAIALLVQHLVVIAPLEVPRR